MNVGPLQGSAADVAMCAMLEISKNSRLRELGWRLLLQVIHHHFFFLSFLVATTFPVAKSFVWETVLKILFSFFFSKLFLRITINLCGTSNQCLQAEKQL